MEVCLLYSVLFQPHVYMFMHDLKEMEKVLRGILDCLLYASA